MIEQATNKDIHTLEDLLADAILWMNTHHIPNLLTYDNTRWDSLSKHYAITDFYIDYLASEPIGCMVLTDEDKTYWADDEKEKTLYLALNLSNWIAMQID